MWRWLGFFFNFIFFVGHIRKLIFKNLKKSKKKIKKLIFENENYN